MTAIFITATGTDVGKTLVTCALIRHFRRAGGAVAAIKPVVSGFDPAALPASDPAALLAALGSAVTIAELERISPWRFAAPLSPDMAAAREGRAIEFAAVAEFCREAVAAHRGHLLIEGIGGIMVPLDARHTVLDLMAELKLPLLLVAGSYVGTISHTLTALEVLARRHLDVAAVAVSESERSAASLSDTVAALARFCDSVDIIGIPRLADTAASHPAFARIASVIANRQRRISSPPL
jgi:dethiobiotin synthetase